MKNQICPICEYEWNLEENGHCCPRCGTDISLKPAEQKCKEAHAIYTLGRKGTNTMMYLTDKRLLFIPEKLKGRGLSMALTAAVVNKMRKKCGILSMPLREIQVKEVKQGLLVKIIQITMPDGEVLKVSVPKRKEWLEVLQEAIEKVNS